MAIEQLACDCAAEIFDLADLTLDCLLEHLIDYFKITGKVCAFQASGQINVHIKIRNENNRALLRTGHFHEFFNVFHADAGKIYSNIRQR
jgi:hypothetical protein